MVGVSDSRIGTDENNMKIKMWTALLTTIRKARNHCQDVDHCSTLGRPLSGWNKCQDKISPEEVVHASLCGRGHQAFVTEAVPLGELLHEEACSLWSYQKGGSTPRTLIPVWTLPLCHISSSLGMLPTRLKRVGKNVQTLWRAELDRLHSMNPPLRDPSQNGKEHTQMIKTSGLP